MSLLSHESVSITSSGFSDGVEFEETFPEPAVAAPAAVVAQPAPIAPPKLMVVRREPAPQPEPEPAPEVPAAVETPHVTEDAVEAAYQAQLERRLREAEEVVTRTVEQLRAEEERRLAEWIRERREEEERRLASRASNEEGLARRIEDMLTEWQQRFETRLEQRRIDEERIAERRRVSDEERLQAWRTELEQALADRFAQRRGSAMLPDRNGELRSSVRVAIDSATSARDVGRVLRDLLAELARTTSFAVALHHTVRDEVAYRYRVASEDDLGALLRRDTLDDGPDSPAAHMDGWVRAHRAMRVGARNTTVHTAQLALRQGEATIGVVTLQSEGEAIPDAILARIADVVLLAAPRLGELRSAGSFRGV